MYGGDQQSDLPLYFCAALIAFGLAVAGSVQDPLPRLSAAPGAEDHQTKAAENPAGQNQEKLTPIWPQSGQTDEIKDAVAGAPVNAAALALAQLRGALPPPGEAAPRPGAAMLAARAAQARGASVPTPAPAAAAKASPSLGSRPPPAPAFKAARPARAGGEPASAAHDAFKPAAAWATRKAAAKNENASEKTHQGRTAVPAAKLWTAGNMKRSSASRTDAEEEGERRGRKHRPLLRRGKSGTLKPPKVKRVPTANPWGQEPPRDLPGGAPFSAVPPDSQAEVEAVAPPPGKPDKLSGAHWHQSGGVDYYHDGDLWGRWSGGRWTWLERKESRWWLWPNAKDSVLLWHEDHWWWQSRGTWFVLHDGDAWMYRFLNDWQQEGLAHADGSRMLFSDDGKRVGVVEPGRGARVYDGQSGDETGELKEGQMPERPHPNAPSALTLPQ